MVCIEKFETRNNKSLHPINDYISKSLMYVCNLNSIYLRIDSFIYLSYFWFRAKTHYTRVVMYYYGLCEN